MSELNPDTIDKPIANADSARLAPIIRALAVAAERVPDFYNQVIARYFELSPESKALMSHTDNHIQGRMMEQVVGLLMEADLESLDIYFAFEAANHHGYGAEPKMYQHLFAACEQVVAAANADDWDQNTATQWQAQTERLLASLNKHLP